MNKAEIISRHAQALKNQVGTSLAIDECEDIMASMMNEAINYTRCCEELNPDFEIGEQVLLTKRTIVTIETFCEDGMIEIDDNNEYYKVDKDELTKRV